MSELYILYSEIAVAFIAMQLTAVGRKDETSVQVKLETIMYICK